MPEPIYIEESDCELIKNVESEHGLRGIGFKFKHPLTGEILGRQAIVLRENPGPLEIAVALRQLADFMEKPDERMVTGEDELEGRELNNSDYKVFRLRIERKRLVDCKSHQESEKLANEKLAKELEALVPAFTQ